MNSPFDLIFVTFDKSDYVLRPIEFNSEDYDYNTLMLKDGTKLSATRAISQCHRCCGPVYFDLTKPLVLYCTSCDTSIKEKSKPFTQSIPVSTLEQLIIIEKSDEKLSEQSSGYVTHSTNDSIGRYIVQQNILPAVTYPNKKKKTDPSLNSNVEFTDIMPMLDAGDITL